MFFNLAELRVKQHNFTKYFMVVALILLTCQMGLAQADSGWRDPSTHRVQFVTVEDAEKPDGSVGDRVTPEYVPQGIMSGDHKHDYSKIRVPVLAFVGSPPVPQAQTSDHHITDNRGGGLRVAGWGDQVSNKENRERGRRRSCH